MSRFIGNVSAYAYAVEKGYTGTEEEFAELMASYATVGQTAVEAAQTATTKASEASQSATTATNKASEATTAAQTATNKSAEAQSSAQTASTKASEASTAATAAQTAKTQTEAAASQALTDIGTARTAAISALQTEGATQTANATAQAQAAAQSATTASTKASEASASATSARQSATNATASATSAAQSASDAQDVLDSIPADYSDISNDVGQLKADLQDIGVETEVSPNLLNPDGVQQYTGLNNDNGKTFSANGYYTTDFIPVTAGKYYSAFIKNNNAIQCAYVPRVCGYSSASEDDFTQALGSISAGSTLNYITIPSGTTHVRLMIKTEYYTTYGTFMFCETDGTNKPNEIVQYYVRTVLNGYATTEDKENIEAGIANLNENIINIPRSTVLIDTNKVKGVLDNFHRSTDITDGYTSYGTSGKAIIENNVASTASGNGYQILKTNIGENQVLGISGDDITIAFNIKDNRNFYFLRSSNTNEGKLLQLYKRENNISIFISQQSLTYKRGFLILHFVGKNINIYNDYIFDVAINTDVEFDKSVGMVFGIIGSEKYYTFGGMDNVGLEYLNGFISPHRLVNNGSEESITINNGEIKLLVDRAQGYSDYNYYRSMLGFKQIPYDNCYCKFSCDFKLDESLEGADDFVLVQWHDNRLIGLGLNPFIAILVQKEQDTQYGHYYGGIYLISFYSAMTPQDNNTSSYTSNTKFKLGELDYNHYHHLEVECRIGYDVSTLPYVECNYDGELICAGIFPSGYKGQNGYNITFGIYGAHQWKTGEDWQSPASNKPFVTFKNVKYIG